jgi:hypothetical protein
MKSKIILIMLLLAIASTDSFARVCRQRQPQTETKTTGVPLDGGLLSILGAAGVAYFVARRKKKNADN